MKMSLWKKISVCSIAGIMIPFCMHSDINHYLSLGIPDAVISIPAFIFSISTFIFIFIWQYRENRQTINSTKVFSFWLGVIIYLEAFTFFRFGFLKLFDLHMQSSLIFDDMPAGSISGYHLTDYYFSRAPAFKIIIGALQITGACALLFKKTRLGGIFILMPVILNIIFIDIFYEIGGGITITAIALFIGFLYLLFQEKQKLITFFLNSKSNITSFTFKRAYIKNTIKTSAFLISLIILIPSIKPVANSSILGKYIVSDLNINDQNVVIDHNNDSLLTTVYFDEHQTCIFRFNDYKNIKIGKAIYNEKTKNISIKWRYPKKSTQISLWELSSPDAENRRVLSGETDNKKFTLTLVKADLPTIVIN